MNYSATLVKKIMRDLDDPGNPNGPPPEPPPEDDSLAKQPPESDRPRLFDGWEGITLILLGVVVPSLVLGVTFISLHERVFRMCLKHPLETIVELLLLTAIPVANYCVWSALTKNEVRHSIRRGLFNGVAIGSTALVATVSAAAMVLSYPAAEIGQQILIGFSLPAGLAFGCAVYLAVKLCQARETGSSRLRCMLFSLCGALLTLLSFFACEAPSFLVRHAEQLSISETKGERQQGYDLMRWLKPDRDIQMECTDARCAGLAGAFIRIDPLTLRQLYFAVSGQPLREITNSNFLSLPDDYLRTHVVGAPVEGLGLVRSGMRGLVHPDSLTATVDWTFVLKNKTYFPQEARAELMLPEGATVSDLTLWIDGEARHGAFGPTNTVRDAYRWVTVNHRDPALVTDLGRGRTLLQCAPVPAQKEMKVCVTVTEQLKPDSLTDAMLTLPRFIDSNFDIKKGDHSLQVRSPLPLSLDLKGIENERSEGNSDFTVSGWLDATAISGTGVSVKLKRHNTVGPIVVKDPVSNSYLTETISQIQTFVPETLVVVLDTSEGMKSDMGKIMNELKTLPLPLQKKTSVIFASDVEQRALKPVPLEEALALTGKIDLSGGKDNLLAVIKAAEVASEAKNGAVLWIHGPQPGFNQELYLTAPFISIPKYYELALDNGLTNVQEVFKNHKEIGPFIAIPRNGAVEKDLDHLVQRWRLGGKEFVASYTESVSPPPATLCSGREAREIANLNALSQCLHLIDERNPDKASQIAARYRLVTLVSGAVVLERTSDYNAWGFQDPNQPKRYSEVLAQKNAENASLAQQPVGVGGSAPVIQNARMQSATNGTIAPQGADATIISGIDTAGTVRVNNLANLEAALNIIANGVELLGILWGPGMIVLAFRKTRSSSRNAQIAIGLVILVGAFCFPGVVNWLVASSRDANLFN